MTDHATVEQLDAMETGIIRAVQSELTAFGQQVAAEFGRVRDELATERSARRQLDEQIRALAGAVERALGAGHAVDAAELRTAVDDLARTTKRRHDELNERVSRVVDELHTGLVTAVEAAAGPIVQDLEHRHDRLSGDVRALDQNLRRFDEQAARMVTHFNTVTRDLEMRADERVDRLGGDVDERLAGIVVRLDEVTAAAARQQTETSQIVGQRVDQAEDRINERIITAEARLTEELGARIADIDAHVGRVSAGLDDSVGLLADRIAATDAKFEDVERRFGEIADAVAAVDAEAIEELQEKVAGAAGEAMLVRIELERFQKHAGEVQDRVGVRLTELETAVQDQHLDVETAIQLERLEEVERAMIALDPTQFVRRGDLERALVQAAGGAHAAPAILRAPDGPVSAPPAAAPTAPSTPTPTPPAPAQPASLAPPPTLAVPPRPAG